MSYASSWILLQLIIIPQPQPYYDLLALNKHRRMVVEEKMRVWLWKLISITHTFTDDGQRETCNCQTHELQTHAKRANINKDR